MSLTVLILALLVGFIGLTVTASRRLAGQSVTGAMVRRVFHYAVLYALMLLVVNGAIDLLTRLLGERSPSADALQFAQALTAVGIGLPIVAALLWWTYRVQRGAPAELTSLAFRAYLTAGSLTGAAMTAGALGDVLATAIGTAGFNETAFSGVLLWGLVWIGHWWTMRRSLSDTNGVHLLLGSAIGLVLSAAGLATLLASSLELLFGTPAIVGPWVGLGSAVGLLTGGSLLWVVYWLFTAVRSRRGTAWYAHVLLLGVAGGLFFGLIGAHALLWRGLVYLLGDPARFTPWMQWETEIAALVVGATVWWYHRDLLRADQHGPVYRIYRYLVCGIGAIALAAAFGVTVVAVLEAIIPAVQVGYTSINTLFGALSLLVLAGPLWWLHWSAVQQAVDRDPAGELDALPRRIFLVTLLGSSGVVAIIALISSVSDIMRDLVEAQLSWATVAEVRIELGYLAAALVVIAYHLAVLRQDGRHTWNDPSEPTGPTELSDPADPVVQPVGRVTLVGRADAHTIKAVQRHTGMRVRLLEIPAAAPWNTEALLARLRHHDPGEDLLVIARDDGLEWHSVQEASHVQ